MKRTNLTIYSAAHFWVDFSCALLMFRCISSASDFALCLLLYNFFAFAMQMPLGILADRFNHNALTAALGCILTAAAYPLYGLCGVPALTACMAGLGNALFHLGGGIDTLNHSQKKGAALGIFVSPGAFGLFLGTKLGKSTLPLLWFGPVGLFVFAILLLWFCTTGKREFTAVSSPFRRVLLRLKRSGANTAFHLKPTSSPLWLIPLFLVVVLRSYMGMNQSFSWKQGVWSWVLLLALVFGKAAGGCLMDRIRPVPAAIGSLGLAALLYFGAGIPVCGTLAVFLFNMTMPITLWAAARLLPGAKGFAFGLLTFGLFLGYIPSAAGLPSLLHDSLSYVLLSLVSMALLVPPLYALQSDGRRRQQTGF
ncbi:MAG: hypothetical protein IJV50_02200 [Lachnospiraceae bacterium]|nr:hypothetical protein [Lachnospiraceae bacterium]